MGGKKREEGLQEFRKHLQDSLHEVIECEVPQTLIDELSEAKMQDLKHGLSQKNKSFEEHLSAEGKSEDELKQQMHNDSERELKLSFALTDIAIKEGLNVEDIEVNQRIAYTAHALRKNVDEILEYVESLGRKVLIRSEIMQEKALGFLEELYRKDSLENESESVSKSSKESAE